MEFKTFLSAFFGKEDMVGIRIFSDRKDEEPEYKGNKYTEQLKNIDALLPVLKQHNEKHRGVFFVVNSGGHLDEEITRINAQFVEMDSGSFSEQQAKIDAFSLPPSVIVKTRKSLHCYWLMNDASVSRFREIQLRLVKQFDGDSMCQNESRVMRIPGFYHNKKEPVMVECIKFQAELIYTQDQLAEQLPKVEIKDYSENDRTEFDGVVGNGRRLLDKCAFCRYCRDNAKSLTEPQWYAMVSNMALAKDGADMVHEISKPYPKYNASETTDKIRHAVSVNKPHTCEYIKNRLGFTGCGSCNVKAPIALAVLSMAEQAEEIADGEVSEDVIFDNKTIELMAYAKKNAPAAYGKFKLKIKGKCSLRDFEAAVKAVKTLDYRDVIEDMAMPLNLDGIELGNAVCPANWDVSMEKGIRKTVSNNDYTKVVTISQSPFIISRRFENVDDDSEKLEISFYRNYKWKYLIAARSAVLNKSSLVSFADTGLLVNSATSNDVVLYLADYENANLNTIPFIKSISRIGWMNDNSFFPYSTNDDVVFDTEYRESNDIYKSMTPCGNYETWKNNMRIMRKNLYGRFLLAASFASPLLEKLSHRVFFIHIWHDSKSGKTAAIKAAVSVWGNPAKLMGSFNATAVGLERMAGTLRHLPFAVDELQVLNEQRMPIESVVFSLGSNFGKLRGAKTGGLQETLQWRNIIMTSGEQPLGKDNDTDGIFSRVMELYAKPTDSQEFARQLHQMSITHYGFAGEEYMKYLISRLKKDNDFIQNDYVKMCESLKMEYASSTHLDNAATVCLGDYYSSMAVFKSDEKTAWEEAVSLGICALHNNKQLEKADAVSRAWDFVIDWLVSNNAKFSSDAIPFYGTKEGNHYFIFPQYLKDMLADNGYDYGKVTRGFKDRGYIETSTNKQGTVLMQIQKKINGTNCKVFSINLDKFQTDSITPLR